MHVKVEVETWPLRTPFRISGAAFDSIQVVVATVNDGRHVGRGEAAGVGYRRDTVDRIAARLREIAALPELSMSRDEVQKLPAGGARNALDCALWELEARQRGCPVWRLAQLDSPRPLLTTYTIGAGGPEEMATKARQFSDARALKIKLTGESIDLQRLRAVRDARPDVWLAVDANQGYTLKRLQELMPDLITAHVQLIEQPLPIGQEAQLESLRSPIPIAADESVQTLEDLPALVGRFDVINIKLDKCGGLTHALRMAREARRLGLRPMVGNMLGTSWAMAPGFLVGQLCEIVDLDGPLLLAGDREPAVRYRDGYVECPDEVWGAP